MKMVNELGISQYIRSIISGESFLLAVVYTIGHIAIASASAYFITGATLQLAALDALIEPIINGIWFYILHSVWKRKFSKVELPHSSA